MMKKKTLKGKEPVRIRFKRLADGSHSIYLDTYFRGTRVYEFLRLYIVPETSAEARRQNAYMLEVANAVKARRVIELVEGRFGVKREEPGAMLLAEYLEHYRVQARQTHRGNSHENNVRCMERHLRDFLGPRMGQLRLSEVDGSLCQGFADYLRRVTMRTGRRLSEASVYHYFSALKVVLAEAVTDGLIATNPVTQMRKGSQPRRPSTTKEFLEADEVARLMVAECRDAEVKRAFLFCCLTGLRLSDVRRLEWRSLRRSGEGWRLSLIMQKTLEPIQCKLSREAAECLPPRGLAGEGDRVFRLPSVNTVERAISRWAASAGITKHVTFHTSRHSYATMALAAGADLYVISRLLGHKSVKTTAVYAAVVDSQRDAAADSVGTLFRESLKRYEGG